MIIRRFDTTKSSNEIFLQFKDEKHLMFLDSSKIGNGLGEYSIIVSNPKLIIESKNQTIKIDGVVQNQNDPFKSLQKILDEHHQTYESELPFVGGFVGFLNYDLKAFIEKLDIHTVDDIDMPDMYFGMYHGAVVIDHLKEIVYLTDANDDGCGFDRIEAMSRLIDSPQKSVVLKEHKEHCEVVSNFEKDAYLSAIEKVRDYIKSGDIYQANMTQRFESELREEPFELYQKLRVINPAPFSSFIDFGTGYVLSSSPERFIKVKNKKIEARPIKGTMPRSHDHQVDEKNKQTLINSEKDKSELLMIVDLERNDLSKIAKTGSVKVTELFKLEAYETVYHLVANIVADIDEQYTVTDTLKATFPGGSITGAPKIRAMEVIDELEPTSRALYTGSIGFIDFNHNMDLNIVIRTFICKNKKAYFQAGGGIVWDSDPELEYQESLDKAFALVNSLNYGVTE